MFLACETKVSLSLTSSGSAKTPTSTGGSGSTENNGTENSGTENPGAEGGGSENSDEEPEEVPDTVASDPSEDKTPKHLIKVPLVTIGAADICAFIDIGLTASFEGKLSLEKKYTKGFVYDSDTGLEKIDFDTSPLVRSADLKITITLDIKVGFEVSVLKGAVTASVAGGIKANATANLIGVSSDIKDNQTYNKTGTNVFKADPETDAECIHSDEKCIKIEITFKVYLEAKVTAGFNFADKEGAFRKLKQKLNKLARFEATLTYETDEILGKFKLPKIVVFCSYNTTGINKGWDCSIQVVDLNESVQCPHQAYRLTFLIGFQNAPDGTSASLKIDNQTYPLDTKNPQNKIVLHANPRSSAYSYGIYVNGTLKVSDSVKITDTFQEITQTISWPQVEKGTGKPVVGDKSTERGPVFTTVTRTTEPEQTYDYSHLIPAPEMRM